MKIFKMFKIFDCLEISLYECNLNKRNFKNLYLVIND